jgi:alkanesulfonate monooxygenase SsuD/methylene tetrahydromethanopterin reductase-like flavin-dependent oxidoreductase (luciferase family)
MQLALMIEGQEDVTWEQWVAIARACETHGIPALFRSDHYLAIDGPPQRGSLDAMGTSCALAAVTDRLQLGTLVSPATFRHPSELAKLAVTADQISGGRFELGLGAGWYEAEHVAYGFGLPALKRRMDVLAEQLAVVRGAWDEGPFSFDGEHYTMRELDAQPKPARGPGRIPLLMGGTAGPRGARLAARYADEYNTTSVSDDAEIAARKARVDAACERAGRASIPFSLMTTVLVANDRDALATRAARLDARAGQTAGTWLSAPPANAIVGTVDEVVARLRALAALGVSRVMCRNVDHTDLEHVALLGDVVGPAVA